MDESINTLPIAGWELRTVPTMDAVIFTPSFIASSMQRPEESIADRNFVMTRPQAIELAEALLRAARKLESADSRSGPDPKH